MRRLRTTFRGEQGSSLLTVIAVATFLSISIAGIVSINGMRQKEMRVDQLRAARDLVYRRTANQISLTTAIRHSMEKSGNNELKSCMNNPAGCGAGLKPFHLYFPFSPTVSSLVASGITPVIYTSTGERGSGPASALVPFEASSFFSVSRRNDSAGQPQWFVTTMPRVSVRALLAANKKLKLADKPLKSEIADDAALTRPPYKTKFEMLVKDVVDSAANCNENSFLVNAQNATGIAAKICRCLPGFTASGSPDRPTCTNNQCKPPKIFMGFQADNTPLCLDQDPNNYICEDKIVKSHGKVQCPTTAGKHDNKMRAAMMNPSNKCRLKTGVAGCPKAKCVECDNMTIKCCRRK